MNKKSKTIPEEIKLQIEIIVADYNIRITDDFYHYVTRYKNNYLFLDRKELNDISPICRLEYTGNMNKWKFAIYKYSSDSYDPEEDFFPGVQYVDGTITGAMKAGLAAYPD
jgi:beta-mannanase